MLWEKVFQAINGEMTERGLTIRSNKETNPLQWFTVFETVVIVRGRMDKRK